MEFRGFTLLEVTIVVTILAIMALIMVPTFAPYEDEQKVILAADELATALRFSHREAKRLGTQIGVSINPGSESFQVVDIATGTLLFHPVKKHPYTGSFDTTSFSSGVDIVDVDALTGVVTVSFLPTGQPLTASDVLIRLSYGVHSRLITVKEETGRVTVQ